MTGDHAEEFGKRLLEEALLYREKLFMVSVIRVLLEFKKLEKLDIKQHWMILMNCCLTVMTCTNQFNSILRKVQGR